MCSTKPDACRKRFRPTRPRCNSLPPTPTRITIWRWPSKKIREPRKALKHWQAYVKLDTSGPWSVHARSQIKRILQADGLKLVHSRPRSV